LVRAWLEVVKGFVDLPERVEKFAFEAIVFTFDERL
jgi:hypothetical protein